MNRHKKLIAAACLLTLVGAGFTPSAWAFRASIGAVAGQKKLTQGMDKKDDLSFSPILLEMAKLIGRTGLPPGFFLQNDSTFPDEPGLDLRTLLLYQAGLIKMPIRLITGRKEPAHTEGAPTLAMPSIPEPRKGITTQDPSSLLPSLASTPLPRQPEGTQVITPKRSVGTPEKISFPLDEAGTLAQTPILSIDISKLQADLKVFGEDTAAPEIKTDVPQLAMAMPRTNAMPFITKNAFRLWTYRPEGKAHGLSSENDAMPGFNGTFVIATTGAIKSITGRHFVLAPGKLLASNQGGELLFKTDSASISVEPNSTAVIEVTQDVQVPGATIRVYAIEARDSAAVSVTSPAKDEAYKLHPGEMLTIKDPKTIARSGFSVKEFVEKNLIANPQASANDAEHYAALSALKKRVNDSR